MLLLVDHDDDHDCDDHVDDDHDDDENGGGVTWYWRSWELWATSLTDTSDVINHWRQYHKYLEGIMPSNNFYQMLRAKFDLNMIKMNYSVLTPGD